MPCNGFWKIQMWIVCSLKDLVCIVMSQTLVIRNSHKVGSALLWDICGDMWYLFTDNLPVNNYHTMPRNMPDEHRSHHHYGRSLKSAMFIHITNAHFIVCFKCSEILKEVTEGLHAYTAFIYMSHNLFIWSNYLLTIALK